MVDRSKWALANGCDLQGETGIFGPSQNYSSRDIAAYTLMKRRLVVISCFAFLFYALFYFQQPFFCIFSCALGIVILGVGLQSIGGMVL